MPRYDYACTVCDHRFEAVQSFTDGPLTECPVCDGRLRKLFSAVGVVFKGSGFYRNDSRPKDAAASGGETKSTTNAETKSETKSENKSETKSETKSAGKSETKSASKSDSNPDGKSDPKRPAAAAGSSTASKSA